MEHFIDDNSQITVICHFRNEEKMLPFWLKHHHKLFDHGVMIDYASTDNSRQIIAALAPSWDVFPSRNKIFSTGPIDEEIMDTENTLKGWKMCLNVTEFLMTDDLHAYINRLLSANASAKGVVTTGFVMVDPENLIGKDPPDARPLFETRHFGYPEPDPLHNHQIDRSRLLHREANGRYGAGRHKTFIQCTNTPPLFLFWYGWSPLHWKIERNESTLPMLDPQDLAKGWGSHHALKGVDILSKWRNGYLNHACDLLDGRNPELKAIAEKIAETY